MTEEERLRRRCESLAKELAVAGTLLAQWSREAPLARPNGIAVPDFPATPPPALRYNVDRVQAKSGQIVLEGWAFDPIRGNPEGGTHAIFVRAGDGGWLAFPALPLPRPDVASHYLPHFGPLPRLAESGFYASVPGELWVNSVAEIIVVQQHRAGYWGRTPAFRQSVAPDQLPKRNRHST